MTFLENYGFMIVLILLGLGILMTLVRLIFGPKLTDRIVSLDTLNVMIIGSIGLLAAILKNELYLDIVLVYAILSFLETIVFSRYVEVHHDSH